MEIFLGNNNQDAIEMGNNQVVSWPWELTIGAISENGEHHAIDIIDPDVDLFYGTKDFSLQGHINIRRISVWGVNNEVEFGEIMVNAYITHSGVPVGGTATFGAAGSQNVEWNATGGWMDDRFSLEIVQEDFGISLDSLVVRLEGELDGTLTPR